MVYAWKVEEIDKCKIRGKTLNSVKTRCQTLADTCKFDPHSINSRYINVAFRITLRQKTKSYNIMSACTVSLHSFTFLGKYDKITKKKV